MAGVTDRPFRMLCKRMGAGYAVSEMVAANPRLWGTDKSRRRTDHAGEVAPIAVQIAGADPQLLADAARYNVDRGAQIIDINMGCPAKKVCNAAAGSALLANEPLVARIVTAVVAAVDVPVTLKIRTGPTSRAQCGHHRVHRAGCRHRGARRARPYARMPVCGPRRVRHDARGEARRAHSGVRERRH
jgi:tRNA-dihydrouridine synthase